MTMCKKIDSMLEDIARDSCMTQSHTFVKKYLVVHCQVK